MGLKRRRPDRGVGRSSGRLMVLLSLWLIAGPVLAADTENIWLDKLDAWVTGGGKLDSMQADVVGSCAKLLYYDRGPSNWAQAVISKDVQD